MPDLVPVITNTNPATWDVAGIVNLLNSHTWSANWTVAAHTVGQGTALQCTATGETHTVNFRKLSSGSGTDMAVSVEPTGTITDPGNDTPTDPTGTTADWSDDWTWNTAHLTPGAGSQFWICEYPDALLFLITDTNNTHFIQLVHVGKIYQPQNANAPSFGQDGLGGLSGDPQLPNVGSAADEWINTGVGASAGLLHYETNNWKPRSHATGMAPTNANAADGTDAEAVIHPAGHPTLCDIGGQLPLIGHYKYFRIVGLTAEPKTIKAAKGSNQGLLHINNTLAVSWMTMIWDRRVIV